ncbi:hypothetical protein BDZ91DRAFT_772282 [Kalaharituber pfeilii]|nr:hypothetical protein BDZ91DRAFT_772282 [Kalaharituber pfeilii]
MSTAAHSRSNEALRITELFRVKDFVAVVTGGGTGIGLMITQALVVNGAKVYITGRRQEALDTVVRNYSKQGSECAGEIIGLTSDVTKREDLKKLADEIMKREPQGVHLVVNNAGVALEAGTTKLDESVVEVDRKNPESISQWLLRADSAVWAQTFETNVTAQYLVAASFLPHLGLALKNTPKYSPSIINIASVAGVTKSPSHGQFAYNLSKAASLHLTRILAFTLTEAKIRVNCIAPGLFPSEMTTSESDERNKSEINKPVDIPAGRPGKEEDMAAAVLYLAGMGGVYLNGQVLYPDGGMVLTTPAAA